MARLYFKTPWSYETDSWFDVTSVNFNSQKVHEDKIFERQDILQFLSQGSKYYKYVSWSTKHNSNVWRQFTRLLIWSQTPDIFGIEISMFERALQYFPLP